MVKHLAVNQTMCRFESCPASESAPNRALFLCGVAGLARLSERARRSRSDDGLEDGQLYCDARRCSISDVYDGEEWNRAAVNRRKRARLPPYT